jgi:hypothetical protein
MQGIPAFLAKVYVFWNFRSAFIAKWHKTSFFPALFSQANPLGTRGLAGFAPLLVQVLLLISSQSH